MIMTSETFENLDMSSMATESFSDIQLSGTVESHRNSSDTASTDILQSPSIADYGRKPGQKDRSSHHRKALDTGVTEIDLPDDVKIDPAVGWLVCIEGVDKGRSFRLVKGNNTIGRPGNGKKYTISLSDQSISRNGACGVIVYNEKSNQFFIRPGDLTGNINLYLNDEILLSARLLSPRAVLEAAGDVLLFIPFCSEKFKWNYEIPKRNSKSASASAEMVGCVRGHYYDPSKNATCPFCAEMEAENDPNGMTRIF